MHVWVQGDIVVIVKGLYKGHTGIVMKVTAKMVMVRVDNLNVEVRIWQSSVSKGDKQRTCNSYLLSKVIKEESSPNELTSVVMHRTKVELETLRAKLDTVIGLLNELGL